MTPAVFKIWEDTATILRAGNNVFYNLYERQKTEITNDFLIRNYTMPGDILEVMFNEQPQSSYQFHKYTTRKIIFRDREAIIISEVTAITVSRKFAIDLLKKARLISHKGNCIEMD